MSNLSLTPISPDTPPRGRLRGLFWAGLLLLLVTVVSLAFLLQRQTAPPGQPDQQTADTRAAPAPPAAASALLPPPSAADFHVPTASDPGTAQLIARLFDESLSLNTRRQAALLLARSGSDEAVAALRSGLAQGPPYLKAAIGEGLGECTNAAAWDLLSDLAGHPEEIAARGAVRGLAARGDAEAVERLGKLLADPAAPLSVRTEAALALGDVRLPAALEVLTRAAKEIDDEAVLEFVLDGLGKRPFAETEDFIRGYLEAEGVPAELKAAAVEALGNAEGNVAPFLLNLLNHPEAELRAAAAWALTTVGAGDVGAQLAAFLKQEPDARVRTRLYQALANGGANQAGAVLALVQNESDPRARLAGLDFLAGSLRVPPDPAVVHFFVRSAVPELESTALRSSDPQSRLLSVIALSRAGTPEAGRALQAIAAQSADQKVVTAAQYALRGPRR